MGKTKPIITEDMSHCLICGSPYPEWHHACFGTADKRIADKYGLIVPLCMEHHRGRTGVHQCRAVDLQIKQLAQRTFEEKVGGREEWMSLFGRNYL